MLNAILSNKDPKVYFQEGSAMMWRHLLRENEDLVTATLMERLSYLPGETAWKVLHETFGAQLPSFRVSRLDGIEFWPRWDYTQEDRSHVEPDALIRFSLGDPAQRWHIIFEAKHGSAQNAEQWRLEQDAYLAMLDATGEDMPDRIVFMALGGLRGRRGTALARSLSLQVDEARRSLKERRGQADVPDILMVAADWSDMAKGLANISADTPHAQRVIDDMIEALATFGYRHVPLSEDMLTVEDFGNWQNSMNTLAGEGSA